CIGVTVAVSERLCSIGRVGARRCVGPERQPTGGRVETAGSQGTKRTASFGRIGIGIPSIRRWIERVRVLQWSTADNQGYDERYYRCFFELIQCIHMSSFIEEMRQTGPEPVIRRQKRCRCMSPRLPFLFPAEFQFEWRGLKEAKNPAGQKSSA